MDVKLKRAIAIGKVFNREATDKDIELYYIDTTQAESMTDLERQKTAFGRSVKAVATHNIDQIKSALQELNADIATHRLRVGSTPRYYLI